MSKKLLYQEIDLAKQQISQEMSHQKTTLKEFSSYFKDFQQIQKQYQEQLFKLTRKEFTCRQFENNSIKEYLDKSIQSTSMIGDIIGKLNEQISSVEQSIFGCYLQIKEDKELLMQKCEQLKKDRDNLLNNKQADKQMIDEFMSSAISSMQLNIEFAIKTEKKKNDKIIEQLKIFFKSQKESNELINNQFIQVQQFLDGLQLTDQRNLSKIKTNLTKQQNEQETKASLENSGGGNKKEQKKPEPQLDLLTTHRSNIQNIRKSLTSNLGNLQLPTIIKDQNGIFSQEIPYNMELAKEFNQQEFYCFILLLLIRYSQKQQDWQMFLTHTKNKFAINLSLMKQLELFSNKISRASEQSLQTSTYISFVKDSINSIQNNECYNEIKQDKKQSQLLKKIILFSLINNYWVQFILPNAFSESKLQQEQFKTKITYYLKQSIIEEVELNTLSYNIQIDEIAYPLNQCLVEMLLQVIIDSSNVDMDYLPYIFQFSQDVLKLSPAHVSVTLLQLAYQKILQPTLQVKNLDIKDAVVVISQLIEQLWEVITNEQSINQSQMQKMMKLKNSDKLFRELLSLIRNFWSQLPSDRSFLFALFNLFYIVANLQLETSNFTNVKDFILSIFESAGNQFYTMTVKREKFCINQITDKSLNQIQILLPSLCKESLELKERYLDNFSLAFKAKLPKDDEDIKSQLFLAFFKGVTIEIFTLIQQTEICIENQLIPEDANGNAFGICFTLAQVDDQIQPLSILPDLLKLIGHSLEFWFQTSQHNTFQILQSLLQKEKFIDDQYSFKELMEFTQTKAAEDFCSILFKSVEALQAVYKFSDKNKFKKLVNEKIEKNLYQAILAYLEQLESSLETRTKAYYQWFPIVLKNKPNFVVNQKDIAEQQLHLVLGMMMRICNINFLQQQLQSFQSQFKIDILEHLTSDFNMKGKSVCKSISQIIIYEIFQVNFFDPWMQDLKTLKNAQQYQQNSEWCIKNQFDEIADFFQIFNKKLPNNFVSIFYDQFTTVFFEKLFYSIFDLNKLTNVPQEQYSELLQFELQQLYKLFEKQISSQVIQKRVSQQLSEIKVAALWFGLQDKDLISTFEQLHIQQDPNKKNCSALYRVILLRKSNSKLKDLAKKYQKLYE